VFGTVDSERWFRQRWFRRLGLGRAAQWKFVCSNLEIFQRWHETVIRELKPAVAFYFNIEIEFLVLYFNITALWNAYPD
jgi:predicted acetyltransferase